MTSVKENIDQQFELLIKDLEKRDERITVMLELPYLDKFGHETMRELVYGCTFKVEVGDKVLCPPTPRGDGRWNTGMVTALDGRGYNGKVKYVRKIDTKDSES